MLLSKLPFAGMEADGSNFCTLSCPAAALEHAAVVTLPGAHGSGADTMPTPGRQGAGLHAPGVTVQGQPVTAP